MTLTKHHGWGNDFLVAFDAVADPAAAARRWCDRRRGIGADGLLLAHLAAGGEPSRWSMQLVNADGSAAEMSGNGIRCFAQAIVRRHPELRSLEVETAAGLRHLEVRATDTTDEVEVSVDMGAVAEGPQPARWAELPHALRDGARFLSLGNPHAVVRVADAAALQALDLVALGAVVPDTNLEAVAPAGRGAIAMRVHERGAGITEACGTGACASAYAARAWGMGGADVTVNMPGGAAAVRLDGDRAVLVGPAVYVATITVDALAAADPSNRDARA